MDFMLSSKLKLTVFFGYGTRGEGRPKVPVLWYSVRLMFLKLGPEYNLLSETNTRQKSDNYHYH
jgi:hypothetical protein